MFNSIQLMQTKGTRPRLLLKGRDTSINNFQQLSQNLGILVEQIFGELIRYSRRSLNDMDHLMEDEERLENCLWNNSTTCQYQLSLSKRKMYTTYIMVGPPASCHSKMMRVEIIVHR